MGEVNYASLVVGLITPLVTHPLEVEAIVTTGENDEVKVTALVNKEDLGRVIGKKGRVAGAIRTMANAVATRNKQSIEIEFASKED